MPNKQRLIATPLELQWPYKRHYGIFKGIQNYAKTHARWDFDTGNSPDLALKRGTRHDGIVGRITPECLRAAKKASIPVVNVWSASPVASRIPTVQIDYYEVGRMAADHLISRGFKKLVCYGFTDNQSSEKQYQGCKETADRHGCNCSRKELSLSWDLDNKNWASFEKSLFDAQAGWEKPVGVVCITDEVARAVATVFLRCGWNIPDELALIGCGDDTLICTSVEPHLSSIDMNYEKCGYEAAHLLDTLMRQGGSPKQLADIPPKGVVMRQSSDAFSVSDPKVAQALRQMAEHCSTAMSVPEIAKAVGIGRKMLERRFRRHLGRTINDELIRLRIAKLKRSLVESDANIHELAIMAGFGNPVSMQKMFKRLTGTTAREYRKLHGRGD